MDMRCCECVFEIYDRDYERRFTHAVTYVAGDALCFEHAGQRLTQRRAQSTTGPDKEMP